MRKCRCRLLDGAGCGKTQKLKIATPYPPLYLPREASAFPTKEGREVSWIETIVNRTNRGLNRLTARAMVVEQLHPMYLLARRVCFEPFLS
jgi:hypothetical protein